MTGWVWAGIFIGLAIVVFAVGVPFLITQKGMRSPYDRRNRDEAGAYFWAKRRWRRREDALSSPPETAASKQRASEPRTRTRP